MKDEFLKAKNVVLGFWRKMIAVPTEYCLKPCYSISLLKTTLKVDSIKKSLF